VKIATAIVAPLVCTLAVLGGIGSFATVRHLAVPWFGTSAWIVPVGVDIGILALLAWDLLMEYLELPWPVLRWTAWAFIAATVYLNVAAADGNLTGSVMHAAMPALFVTAIEGIRHLIRQLTGLASGNRIERIPAARWLFAPRTSFLLARRMVLWHVTSYRQGLRLEYGRLRTIARLQQAHGRWRWRWKAPLQDRLALRLQPAGSVAGVSGGTPATGPALMAELLSHLPRNCMIEPPRSTTTPVNPRDQHLIDAAASILRDAERDGARLSQAALARQLRTKGHRIPNGRLSWLTRSVQLALQRESREFSYGSTEP
jgi:hypothetical protein